jgi:Cu/Zn superoxide dismutase
VITGDIRGLNPGYHGLTIHETKPDSENSCLGIGGHYNPFNSKHGNFIDETRHAGDLGNIWADE